MTRPATKRPAMPFYVKDFLEDETVKLMDLDAIGAYVLLILHQWTHGSIPADVAALGKICGNISLRKMRRLWATMDGKFYPVDGDQTRLQNKKTERVREEQEAYLEEKRKNGKAGGLKAAENRRKVQHSKYQKGSSASSGASSGATDSLVANGHAAVAVAVAVPLSKERGSSEPSVEPVGDVAQRILQRHQPERAAS